MSRCCDNTLTLALSAAWAESLRALASESVSPHAGCNPRQPVYITGLTIILAFVMPADIRASDAQEMLEMINQALDAVEDLRADIEYDDAYTGESSILVEPVSRGLSRVLGAIRDESYRPGSGDWFDFIEPFRDMDHRAVPFWPLLKPIIDTHEQGYADSKSAE